MVTVESIALCLYHDTWFSPSKSSNKISVKDESGNTMNIPRSYYHKFETGERIIVRVSEHGTSLETWLRRRQDPSKSLQNLSVVFSNTPVTSELKTEPKKVVDSDGNVTTQYTYFVVEQYVYRMDSIGMKDFQDVIKKIKKLDENNVFTDPLKKKPSKFASRTLLKPQDSEGKPIPPSTNPVHSRQAVVAANKEKEVDAKGNVIPESMLRSIICECVSKVLQEYYNDNQFFGWQFAKKHFIEGGVDKITLKKLHAAYDKYGKECAAKDEVPNAIGFDIWRGQKDKEWTNKGKGLKFPDYL